MASLMIHLIIGHKYCDFHKEVNRVEFVNGCLAPDLLPNKDKSHYIPPYREKPTYTDAILNRVDLEKFARVNVINNDYTRGFFLHLVTDFVFYVLYMSKLDKFKELENGDYAYVSDQVYTEYDRVAFFLKQRYGAKIDMSILIPRASQTLCEEPRIFDINDIEKVMDACASLDLDSLYQDILKGDKTQLFKLKF